MLDVNINFKEMFKGCFMDKYTTSNDILKETIEQTKDHEAIISMILLKIVNNSSSIKCRIQNGYQNVQSKNHSLRSSNSKIMILNTYQPKIIQKSRKQ